MIYIIKNIDESIGIITVLPTGVIRHSDNAKIRIFGHKQIDPKGGKKGRVVIYGGDNYTVFELTVGDESYNICDLDVDSVNGYTILFPNIEEDVLDKWDKDQRDKIVSVRKGLLSEIPQSREFRNAWKDTGENIDHDIDKVKNMHVDTLRVKRNNLLKDKDVEWIQAMGKGNTKKASEIEADKQKLRDFPFLIEKDLKKAKTIEDIKKICPF